MRVSWCTKFLPGNRGLRPSSSDKMQPADHMSTYTWVEFRIKGDVYVTVYKTSMAKSTRVRGLA